MRKILLATAAGFAALVANGATPAPAYAQAAQATGQTPQPGLTLTTSGRFRFHGAYIDQDGDSANVSVGGGNAAGDKLSKYDFNTYGRLRFDLSGRNESGLIYGGRLEARMNAGGGGSSATLFFRRITGFIGTPTLGQLRFGSGNVMAVEQMHVGHIMGTIGTGLLDGDAGDFVYTGGGFLSANNFWYSSSTVNRSTAIGYYSPQFAGFDLGLSFAPSEKAFLGDCGSALMRDCDRIERVGSGSANQVRNIIDGMVRYRGTFGGVGLAASLGGRMASTADATGGATAFKNPWGVIGGAEVTFAGFTVGGLLHTGKYGRSFTALQDTATAGTKDSALGWQLGARYTFGAFTVGAAYHQLKTEGSQTNPADLKELGFGFGGSYALGPGLALFAEYLYSEVKESGRDFFNYQTGVQDKMTGNAVLVGVGIGF